MSIVQSSLVAVFSAGILFLMLCLVPAFLIVVCSVVVIWFVQWLGPIHWCHWQGADNKKNSVRFPHQITDIKSVK